MLHGGVQRLGSGFAIGIGVDDARTFGLSRLQSRRGRFHETLLDPTIRREACIGVREEAASDRRRRFIVGGGGVGCGAEQAMKDTALGERNAVTNIADSLIIIFRK